jgi:hypothetical protein
MLSKATSRRCWCRMTLRAFEPPHPESNLEQAAIALKRHTRTRYWRLAHLCRPSDRASVSHLCICRARLLLPVEQPPPIQFAFASPAMTLAASPRAQQVEISMIVDLFRFWRLRPSALRLFSPSGRVTTASTNSGSVEVLSSMIGRNQPTLRGYSTNISLDRIVFASP